MIATVAQGIDSLVHVFEAEKLSRRHTLGHHKNKVQSIALRVATPAESKA